MYRWKHRAEGCVCVCVDRYSNIGKYDWMLTSCTVRAYIYVCVYMYIYTHIHFSWFYCSLSTVYFIVFMPSLYTKLLSTLWDEGVHSILNWKTIKSSSLEHFCNHSLIKDFVKNEWEYPCSTYHKCRSDKPGQHVMSKQLQNIQYAWWWWWWWRDMRKMIDVGLFSESKM